MLLLDGKNYLVLGGISAILMSITYIVIQDILEYFVGISSLADLHTSFGYMIDPETLYHLGMILMFISIMGMLVGVGYLGGSKKFSRTSGLVAGIFEILRFLGLLFISVSLVWASRIVKKINAEDLIAFIGSIMDLIGQIVVLLLLFIIGAVLFAFFTLLGFFSSLIYFIKSEKGKFGIIGIILIYMGLMSMILLMHSPILIAGYIIIGLTMIRQANVKTEYEEPEEYGSLKYE